MGQKRLIFFLVCAGGFTLAACLSSCGYTQKIRDFFDTPIIIFQSEEAVARENALREYVDYRKLGESEGNFLRNGVTADAGRVERVVPNSRAAIRLLLAGAPDWIIVDVKRTRDNELVTCSFDRTGVLASEDFAISETTYDRLRLIQLFPEDLKPRERGIRGESLPLLIDVVRDIVSQNPNHPMSLAASERKTTDLLELERQARFTRLALRLDDDVPLDAVQVLSEFFGIGAWLGIVSPSLLELTRVRSAIPQAKLFWSLSERENLESNLTLARKAGVEVVLLPSAEVRSTDFELARSADIELGISDVRTPGRAADLYEMGATRLVSHDPMTLNRVWRERMLGETADSKVPVTASSEDGDIISE